MNEVHIAEARINVFIKPKNMFWLDCLTLSQDQVMLLVAVRMGHLAVLWKGREIGGTSEDRDSVVQFGRTFSLVPCIALHPPTTS